LYGEPIRHYGGTISDVVGDAALAIWASPAPDAPLQCALGQRVALGDLRPESARHEGDRPGGAHPK